MTTEQFKTVVNQYEKLVFTICFQFVRDYHEAENLAQETFLSAYTHIDSCKGDSIKPWLARIATNKAKDYLKSAYSRHVQLSAQEEEEREVISLEPKPEEIFLEKESIEKIKQKIYALKEPYHKVSVLYFLEEKTTEEIAVILKRPRKTVQTQLLRAKTMLQKNLKGEV